MHVRAGILSLVAHLSLLATTTLARTYSGGVDMDEACLREHGRGFFAELLGNTAFDWACIAGIVVIERRPVNVNAYCSWKYERGAYADAQGGGPYDWGCFWP
jgi:hypothetical protein